MRIVTDEQERWIPGVSLPPDRSESEIGRSPIQDVHTEFLALASVADTASDIAPQIRVLRIGKKTGVPKTGVPEEVIMPDTKVLFGVELFEVDSSNIVRVGWEKTPKRRLLVLYKNGDLYEYDDVEQGHYVTLLKPDTSVGKYLRSYIISRYRTKKLENVLNTPDTP